MNSEADRQRQINCPIFQFSVKAYEDGRTHSRVAGLLYCRETKTVAEDNTSQQTRTGIPGKAAAEATGHWRDVYNVEIVKAASLILSFTCYIFKHTVP